MKHMQQTSQHKINDSLSEKRCKFFVHLAKSQKKHMKPAQSNKELSIDQKKNCQRQGKPIPAHRAHNRKKKMKSQNENSKTQKEKCQTKSKTGFSLQQKNQKKIKINLLTPFSHPICNSF